MHFSFFAAVFAVSFTVASPLLSRDTCTVPSSSGLAAAKKAIYDAKLVPDLISSFDPSLLIRAAYSGKEVTLGNSFATTRKSFQLQEKACAHRLVETLAQPTFSITKEANFDSATKYTVLFLDPDVPSPNLPLDRILLGNFVHLIVADVQPDCEYLNPCSIHPSSGVQAGI